MHAVTDESTAVDSNQTNSTETQLTQEEKEEPCKKHSSPALSPEAQSLDEGELKIDEKIEETEEKCDEIDENNDETVGKTLKHENDEKEIKKEPELEVKDEIITEEKFILEPMVNLETFEPPSEEQPALDCSSNNQSSDQPALDNNQAEHSSSSQDSVEFRLTNRAHRKRKGVEEPKTTKRLKRQILAQYPKHERMLTEYMMNSGNNQVKDVVHHMEQVLAEIQTLSDLAREKEQEWNSILHLQKVKEELLLRLTRRKEILEMNIGSKPAPRNNTSGGLVVLPVNNINNSVIEKDNLSNSRIQPKIRIPPQAHSNNGNTNRLAYQPFILPKINNQNGVNNHLDGHLGHNFNHMGNHVNNIGNDLSMNGNQSMGRQGAIKDVKSIIADYRQRHPEAVPRRGRRMKSILNPQLGNGPMTGQPVRPNLNSGSNDVARMSELGLLLTAADMQNSRPSSSESAHSNPGNLLSELARQQSTMMSYPDVTLHAVASDTMAGNQTGQSLLHGILTKKIPFSQSSRSTNQNTPIISTDSRGQSFSPTLARLLTAPERNSNSTMSNINGTQYNNLPGTSTVTKATRRISIEKIEEVTITPVHDVTNDTSGMSVDQEEPSAENSEIVGEDSEDSPPACQGCQKLEAHYVCAGCANQWYCSRECQVKAWEVHSEVCKG